MSPPFYVKLRHVDTHFKSIYVNLRHVDTHLGPVGAIHLLGPVGPIHLLGLVGPIHFQSFLMKNDMLGRFLLKCRFFSTKNLLRPPHNPELDKKNTKSILIYIYIYIFPIYPLYIPYILLTANC